MRSAKKKGLLFAGLLCLGAGFSSGVQAACAFPAGSSEQRTSFNMGTRTVQRDTPAGTVLAEVKVAEGALDQKVTCTAGTWTYTMGELKFPTLSAYGNGVYDTNIQGVGIRLYSHSQGDASKRTLPYSGSFTNPPITSVWTRNGRSVQLVKTSSDSVGAGAISTGTLIRMYMASSPRVYYATMTLTGGTIVRAACTVTTTSIPVPLGDKMTSEFTGVGYTSKNTSFSIPLNCSANTRVKVTIDGTADPSGVKGVIALSPSASETVAKGVGVQILYNNAPITLGSLITVGTAGNGAYNIPLIGRYYQTAAKVIGGKANATATFTMTYN